MVNMKQALLTLKIIHASLFMGPTLFLFVILFISQSGDYSGGNPDGNLSFIMVIGSLLAYAVSVAFAIIIIAVAI